VRVLEAAVYSGSMARAGGDLLLEFEAARARSRIRIARGGLARLGAFVRETTTAPQVVLVTDARVGALYGGPARRSLERSGIDVRVVRVPNGEMAKRAGVLARLWDAFAAAGLDRGGSVVALGGGVVGDLAGFAAATWLRGVAWVAVPTTVLAQVDASVGGKTAIDLRSGKNLVGAFHQPAGVLVDPATLETLPPRQRRNGLAEVVKMGFAVDRSLWDWLEANLDALDEGEPSALAGAVERSIRAKARVVLADEREAPGGGRTALNFGHTLGHAIEASLGYRGLLHGEAVAIGMRAAAWLSVRVAGLAPESHVRLEAALDHLGLPARMPRVGVGRLLKAMQQDKKRASGAVRWVLTPRIGDASVPRAVESRLVRAALAFAGASTTRA
jgi:3-dehydroquinate synthase